MQLLWVISRRNISFRHSEQISLSQLFRILRLIWMALMSVPPPDTRLILPAYIGGIEKNPSQPQGGLLGRVLNSKCRPPDVPSGIRMGVVWLPNNGCRLQVWYQPSLLNIYSLFVCATPVSLSLFFPTRLQARGSASALQPLCINQKYQTWRTLESPQEIVRGVSRQSDLSYSSMTWSIAIDNTCCMTRVSRVRNPERLSSLNTTIMTVMPRMNIW